MLNTQKKKMEDETKSLPLPWLRFFPPHIFLPLECVLFTHTIPPPPINRHPLRLEEHIATTNSTLSTSPINLDIPENMSDKCGNCDCSDKSQCGKTGYTADIIETEKSYVVVMDAPAANEHDGKCKCGSSCSCTDCTCGH